MIELIETEVTELVTSRELAQASPAAMMMAALSSGASLEHLSQMLDLQERYERREAEKAYNVAFANFKAEAVRVLKTTKVTAGPLQGKTYAELYSVVDAVTPALSRHGLSAAWKITKDEKDWLEVTCTLKHIEGHAESVSMGGPPDAGGAKNALQARASTKSYLERYTLKAVCGVAEGGDDNDGADGRAADWLAQAESATTEDDLSQIVKDGGAAFTTARDVPGYAAFMRVARKRSVEIKGAKHA